MSNNSVINSFFWKASERLLVQGLGILVQIILARLLLPEDFAKLAIISAIVNYLGLFVQSGLSVAVVQKKELTKEDLATLTTISLIVATILFICLFVSAPSISSFYKMDDLCWPIRVMGLSLFLYSFNSIQTGILQRKMMFRTIFFRSMLATPLSALIGIVMAYMGLGIWALIAFSISNILIVVIFMSFIPELRLAFGFSTQSAKELYSFSVKILGTSLVSAGGDTVRTLTIGKHFSPNQLAYFDRGLNYSGLVTQVVNTSLSSVLLPVFSRSQDDRKQLLFMARRSVKLTSFVMIPILVFVSMAAEPLVRVILTEKWVPCAVYLSLFCLLRIPGVITSIDKQVYYAIGKSQIGLYYEISLLTANLISLIVLIPYGVLAIAIGFTVIEYLGNFCLFVISSRVYNYSLCGHLIDVSKPVLSGVIMGLVIYSMQLAIDNSYLLLVSQLIAGGVSYLLFSYLLKDDSLKYLLEHIKNRINN